MLLVSGEPKISARGRLTTRARDRRRPTAAWRICSIRELQYTMVPVISRPKMPIAFIAVASSIASLDREGLCLRFLHTKGHLIAALDHTALSLVIRTSPPLFVVNMNAILTQSVTKDL